MAALWDKILFWKKQKMFEENVDFILKEVEDTDVVSVKFLKGKYKDVVYCYGGANLQEQGEGAKLSFDFIILHPGEYTVESLTSDDEFHTMIGDLLVQMIIAEGQNGSPRNNHSEEPDSY